MEAQNFFMLRRPLLPTDFFFSFQKAVGSDQEVFESYLRLIYSDPRLQNAVHLASPALLQQVQRLLNGGLQNGKEDLLKTLYKYLIRMSTRCTPFGLFAGYSLGAITENTRIYFDSEDSLNPHTKLDAEICWRLVNQIMESTMVSSQLKFFPNSSLYKIMDSYRYIERHADGKMLALSAIKSSRFLERLLAHAKAGRTVGELTEILRQYNVGKKTSEMFLNSLIKSQFLVSSFEINAAGENYLERIERELRTMTGCEEHVAAIGKIQTLVKSGSATSIIQQSLTYLFEKSGLKVADKSFLQTDLAFRTSVCEISRSTVNLLGSEIQELSFLTSETKSPDLEAFASRLFSHFGNKPVPLLPALDPASGIGYGTLDPAVNSSLTLLTGLTESAALEVIEHNDTPLSKLQKKILDITKQTGSTAYVLTAEDIASFKNQTPRLLPESFYVFGSITSSTESDVDKGDFLFDLKAVTGPSALNLMSRFAQSDDDLKKQFKNAVRLEEAQNPDVIFAEICHVPGIQVLTVVNRPSLRSYEIPFLSCSSLPPANQIQPSELLVSSPDGRQIILSCERLGKRIIPRLTSAHYYANGLPFYRFLCELAQQSDGAHLGWNWDDLSSEPFLPRITYKHLILQKASWQLNWNEFEKAMANDEDQLSAWAAFAGCRKLPRYFQVQQGDNELLIDGQSPFSIQILEDTLKKGRPLTLTEYLEAEGRGFLSEKSNSLANEVIIPFLNPRQKPEKKSQSKTQDVQALFHLGSEWLYVMLYCSEQAADFLLYEIIAPFCERLHSKDKLIKWFFIRYYDPKPHVRVRLNFNTGKITWSSLLNAFQKKILPYLQSGLISAFKTDEYVREMDRYNVLPYERMESIFFADSHQVCNSLGMLAQNKDPDLRWLLALRGCESILSGAGLSSMEKFALIKRLHSDFSLEFNAGATDIVLLDQKYRKYKKRIFSFLNQKKDAENEIAAFTKNFDNLSDCINFTLSSGSDIYRQDLIDTAAHLMHLFLNRWFNQMHRKQEWIVYHFLKKYYDMILNLKKTSKI